MDFIHVSAAFYATARPFSMGCSPHMFFRGHDAALFNLFVFRGYSVGGKTVPSGWRVSFNRATRAPSVVSTRNS